jgi:hypothetical protein
VWAALDPPAPQQQRARLRGERRATALSFCRLMAVEGAQRVARRLIPDSGKGLTLNFTRDAWGAPQAAFNHSCACVGAGACTPRIKWNGYPMLPTPYQGT